MNYEFYADVFFLTNWYLDFLAVYAVGEVLQQKKKLLRYLLGCAVSSLLGCILFLQIENYDFYLLCIHFIVNPGMVIFCFFPAERRIYINAFLLMYFVILMLGGSVQWMYVTVADGHYYELCLILTSVPVIIFLYILRRKRKNVQIFYRVWIEHQGKKIALQALYDTGNCLVDPYISQPVHVVAPEVLSLLGGREKFALRLVPFSSVGRENGMLEAFTVECIRVEEEGRDIKLAPAVLAAAGNGIFKDRSYQMILNSSLGERIERKEEETCT